MINQTIAIFDPLNRFLWTSVIILLYICSVLSLFNGFRSSYLSNINNSQYQNSISIKEYGASILKAIGFLFLGLANSRLCFFISDYYRNGYYIGHSFYPLEGGNAFLYNTWGSLGTLNFLIGISIFYYFMSRFYSHSRLFLFPILINIIFGIWIIVGKDLMERLPTYLSVGLNSFFIMLLLLTQFKSEKKRIRMISYFLIIGIIFYIIGSVFDSGLIKELNPILPYLSPTYMIIGIIITIISISYYPHTYLKLKRTFIFFTALFTVSFFSALILSIITLIDNSVDNIVTISIFTLIISLFIIFLYILYNFKFSLESLEGKNKNDVSIFGKDLLSIILFRNESGQIKYTRDLSTSHYNIIEDMIWENEEEKNEFIQYFLSLTPKEREDILLRYFGREKK